MRTTLVAVVLLGALGCDAEPEPPSPFETIQPLRTRAGFLRFTTSAIHDEEAAEVFLERLRAGRESADVRRALVEALPRTGGEFGDALVELMPREEDVDVRVAMVGALRRAPGTPAERGLRLAIEDAAEPVRTEAARVMGARPDAGRYADALVTATVDGSAPTRAAAVRSLGLLGDPGLHTTIALRRSDDDERVRHEAERAATRLTR